MYRLYYFASVVVPRLPHSFVMALSRLIGFAAWLLGHKARKQATINMLHVLGPQVKATRAGRKTLRRTVRKMFLNNARNYLESLYLLRLKREDLMRRLIYKGGLDHLDAALAQGKGVIILSIHMGPFDYIAQWFAFQNYSLTVPVENLKDERLLELVLKLRRAQGLQFVPLGGSAPLRSMIQALRKNQIVVVTLDRAIVGETIERPFFGAPALFPNGPFSLAQRTGAVLLAGFGWYESHGRMGGKIVPVTLAMSEDERNDPDKVMQKVLETLEENIRARPEQWVMFSPLWVEDMPAT